MRAPLKTWALALCRRHDELPAGELTGAVANRIAAALGVDTVADAPAIGLDLPELPAPPGGGGWANPWLLGVVHEQAATAEQRKARGAWYTPRPVVEGLVRLATADGRPPAFVVDPTCGGGAFLLAALDRLVELGVEPHEAVERVGGIDLDPEAVAVSRWSVLLWLATQFGPGHRALNSIKGAKLLFQCGDALTDEWPDWPDPLLVVGNPPFASPLKSGALSPPAARYRAEHSDLLGPYADIAAAHLLRAVTRISEGSMVAMVQPQSVLSSRDTDGLRARLDHVAPLRALWVCREAVFDAGVRACAPVLEVGADGSGRVLLASGPDVAVGAVRAPQPWSCHGADALGAPSLDAVTFAVPSHRVSAPETPVQGTLALGLLPLPTPVRPSPPTAVLGDLVEATAGFRDEHYGLVSVCREAEPNEVTGDGVGTARLVTVGAVDPLNLAWGRRPTRFGGEDWTRPVVDRTGLSPRVAAFFDRRLEPKVLLATQTKLLEPVVDRIGDLMPTTPLIAVHADARDLDRVAAVLLSPSIVVWAWRRWFGSALSVDAVKLAAAQVAELPLPSDELAWVEAAAVVAANDNADPASAWDAAAVVATIMNEAYAAPSEVLAWWRARCKPRPEPSPQDG